MAVTDQWEVQRNKKWAVLVSQHYREGIVKRRTGERRHGNEARNSKGISVE